ncbi:MAG: VWA domain-containing protein [Bacteroidetes bacterium]|nr:VWA domain-containing protein [Bacteroidota bacterium]
MLDASSSMSYQWNVGYSRFDVASSILLKIMDSAYTINNEIEFGVRAYGTTYPAQLKNCTDTRLEVPFNLQNTTQVKTRLKSIVPLGSSPIAYSLQQASENELNDYKLYDYSVIFITDGGESCHGDVCGIYQELLQKKISIKPYIIGLDHNETLKSYYSCLGNYIEVSTPEDIEKAINLIIDANKSIIDKPKQLKLVTQLSNTPAITAMVPAKPPVVDIEFLHYFAYKPKLGLPLSLKRPTALRIPKKKVSLVFEYEVPKQNSLVLADIPYQLYRFPVKKSTAKAPKKLVVKKQKASLRFEYDEAKKSSPGLVELIPIFRKISPIAAKPILSKKSNFKFAKKASLQFEYEEPKKTSPAMVVISPFYSNIKLKSSRVSVPNQKSNYRFAKKASLQLPYEEPKKTSPPMADVNPIYKSVRIVKSPSTLKSRNTKYKFAKSAKLILPYEVPKKEILDKIAFVKYPRRYSYAFRMPEMKPMNLKNRKVSLRFVVEEKKDIVKKDTIIPTTPINFPNSTVEFTTEVAVDPDTRVQVYFKGTNGKTYNSAKPMIEMQDIASGITLTKFEREMVGAEPVPQNVKPGKYNLIIKGFDDLYANNIEIKPKTITKVIIKVSDGTLKFTYQGNIKRPVVEYTAKVKRLFGTTSIVMQKCDESKMYEPATYHVEINTLPVYKATIDLTFDATYEIQISEPGTLSLMNSNALGKVQIQYMLGDQFVTFYTMNVTGNPSEQRIQLLPYSYKLIYPIDPKIPQLGNKELMIKIRSNNQLDLELK